MKKKLISVGLVLVLMLSLCGCEARKTCPLCGKTFLGDGVQMGEEIICEDCDRDNQFLNEFMSTMQ